VGWAGLPVFGSRGDGRWATGNGEVAYGNRLSCMWEEGVNNQSRSERCCCQASIPSFPHPVQQSVPCIHSFSPQLPFDSTTSPERRTLLGQFYTSIQQRPLLHVPCAMVPKPPGAGAVNKVGAPRLPPLPRLKIKRPNQAQENPCLGIMTSMLGCWASSGQGAVGCAALEQQLRSCMDAGVSEHLIHLHRLDLIVLTALTSTESENPEKEYYQPPSLAHVPKHHRST
jgi:hypothetical protein